MPRCRQFYLKKYNFYFCLVLSGGAVVAAPLVLGAVGFTAAGVAAGSWAAGMMSAAAVANGGAVAAGSAVAVLQSAGELNFMMPQMDHETC